MRTIYNQDKRTGLYLPDGIRPQASGYSETGASRTRRAFKGFNAHSGSPNEDINWNNYTLRQRGRMLYMSSPLATSAINTNRTKVVGIGLALKPAIDRETLGLSPEAAEEWQRHTKAEFSLWAKRKDACDAIGVNGFYALQQLALVSWLMSGDVFAVIKRRPPDRIRPYSLRIHLVEADRVRTPMEYGGTTFPSITNGKNPNTENRIFDGVEVDASGMVVAYFVHSTYPWEATMAENEWVRVEAYGKKTGLPNILHIMGSERPDQYRGVTYLAQVMEPLLQLRRYTDSALMMALVQSFFTAWIITKSNPDGIPFNETGDGVVGVPGSNPSEAPRGENEYGMGAGTINVVPEGEDVKFGNPTMPVASFDTFVKTFCKLVGAGLGIPYDVLVKEYNSSYSAARAALLDAWEEFRMRRTWFVDDFCQPVYEIWLSEAVARGRIIAPGFFDDPLIRAAWCSAQWIGPVQGSLDPLKEANAAVLKIQHGLKTHEQATMEDSGGDWNANVEQLKAENEKLTAAGGGGPIQLTVDPNKDDDDEGGDSK
ncbi:phage portal protein [Flintibacter muris]|uniref:phage portal protein n=1 Tax=Flintibacter muris TaxID=2941327 RepID=UPI00203DB297|nr:phage portal protein [Flintibacter muris]